MLNYVVLVGRINEIVLDDENNNCIIKVKVDKLCKNDNGNYEYNIITCVVKPSLSNQINNICGIDDLIGIKGSLENKEELYVLVDKITLISNKDNNKVEA